jgi:hypothetical protein
MTFAARTLGYLKIDKTIFSMTAAFDGIVTTGFIRGSLGSVTPSPVLFADGVGNLLQLSNVSTTAVLKIDGFSSNPLQTYFLSINANSVTNTSAAASYSYSAGVATWSWSSSFNFVNSIVYNPVTLNY